MAARGGKVGLFGPRLTALVTFLKGICHALFSTIRKLLRDVVWVDVYREEESHETLAVAIDIMPPTTPRGAMAIL